MGIKSKDLLGLQGVSREEIELVINTADSLKEIMTRDIKKVPTLRGRVVINLFYEPSTRTRTSFELAGKYMSADMSNLNVSTSSVVKGETLIDTGKTLDAMATDIVIIRHSAAGAPALLGRSMKARIINAGDGYHEHPTQALLDMLTIKQYKGKIEGLKVAIIGDLAHSRVARSNFWGLTTMGADVVLCGPTTLIPRDLQKAGAKIVTNMDEAVKDADVVMMLRVQLERQQKGLFPSIREYAQYYGLNTKRLSLAKADALVMHPGPMNRGVEISSDVADGVQSVIEEQVTNGVAVRMALLYLMGGGASDAVTA
ncbi:aspartate carbamoyltransferase catalytic subunit [Desulfitibacter alkalitolerans]|uniref:aspartate carbamoyltransferase catalytic subunit n=1 Tax=Desulfitibacter alkalitolerans TaxID=264641 RepID=UPI00048268C7|nr:aspartate carbamoyltransferase catalytic subunit [Desulfitibacter alkalitolerans]